MKGNRRNTKRGGASVQQAKLGVDRPMGWKRSVGYRTNLYVETKPTRLGTRLHPTNAADIPEPKPKLRLV